jgi:capsule polysaccharide export protein KpsE/RkpR
MESMRHPVVVREEDPIAEPELVSRADGFEVEADVARPDTATDSLDTVEMLALLWERRALLSKVAVRALIISTLIAFLIPTKYDSTVRLMPPDSLGDSGMILAALSASGAGSGSGSGKVPTGLASIAGSALGMKNNGALFVDLLRSRTVQTHIVDKFHLRGRFWDRYEDDARNTLDDHTQVSEDRKSGVISVTVRASSPERARDIAKAYVDELDSLLSHVSTFSARRERIFIEQRLTSVKSDLEDAERQFSAFASKNTALDIKEQTKAMVESAAVLEGQIVVTESELESMRQIYTPNNVRVRAMQARVDELKREAEKLGGTDASLLPGATQTDQQFPSVRKLPLLGVEWADLYRRLKVQETVFELLSQRYELARIQEAKEVPTVNVVDQAFVPEKKSSPQRWLVIFLLTFLSLAGACAWVVGIAHWQRVSDDDRGKQLAASVWHSAERGTSAWKRRIRRLWKKPESSN